MKNGLGKAGVAKLNTQTALLSVIVLVLACAVLKVCQSVVIPLIFAFLLCYLTSPVLTLLKKLRIPAGGCFYYRAAAFGHGLSLRDVFV